MHRSTSHLGLAAAFSFLAACTATGDSAKLASPPEFVARQASHEPGELVYLERTDTGPALARTSYTGSLGGAAVSVVRLHGETFAFLAPDVAPGSLELRLDTERGVAVVPVGIAAPTASPADPAAAVEQHLAGVREVLDVLWLVQSETGGGGALSADLAALEAYYAEAQASLAAATPQQVAAAARILEANSAGLAAATGAAKGAFGGARAAPFGSSPRCLELHPDVEGAAECVADRVMTRLVPLVATAAIALLNPEPLTRALTVVATAAQLLWMNEWLIAELRVGLVQVGALALAGGEESAAKRASGARSRPGAAGARAASAAAPSLTVESGVPLHVAFTSEYRHVGTEDERSSSAVLRAIATGVGKFGDLWRRAASLLPAGWASAPFALAETPATDRARVSPAHLAVEAHVLPGVTLTAEKDASGFTLHADGSGTSEYTVLMEVTYASSLAQSTSYFEVKVLPRGPPADCAIPEGATGTQLFGEWAFVPYVSGGFRDPATAWVYRDADGIDPQRRAVRLNFDRLNFVNNADGTTTYLEPHKEIRVWCQWNAGPEEPWFDGPEDEVFCSVDLHVNFSFTRVDWTWARLRMDEFRLPLTMTTEVADTSGRVRGRLEYLRGTSWPCLQAVFDLPAGAGWITW